jgi:hypothetical protein
MVAVAIVALAARSPDGSGLPAKSNVAPPADSKSFIVHEWGTFTGFAGSDGVHIPFNTNIGGDLPSFVVNRRDHAMRDDPAAKQAMLFTKWGGMAALQRMETPVLYFYADQPKDVSVRVDFPQGTLTEFYPPVQEISPPFGFAPGEPWTRAPAQKNLASLEGSTIGHNMRIAVETVIARGAAADPFIDWGRVRIIPKPTVDELKQIPPVTEQRQHYDLARETDSALVQITDPKGNVHADKFLFYRGLGNFTLPVSLQARGNDRFELRSSGATPISAAFLLHSDVSGAIRFTSIRGVSGTQSIVLPPAVRTQSELSEAIAQALIAEGLYEKEARAMVRTWQADWLAERGTRLLYIVPRPVTDSLLPLRMEPTPKESVRVLVGRIDILQPELEARMLSAMKRVATGGPGALTEQEVREFDSLGRFLYPGLKHVAELTGDEKAAQFVQVVYEATARRKAAMNEAAKPK